MALDPHLGYRSLLLHFDGSNGSTTFTDSSPHAHACTAVGNAQLTTANSVFGGASLLLDGSGDMCNVAYSAALNLAGGDWTVQGRSRATSTADQVCLVDFGGTAGSAGFLIYRSSGDTRRLQVYNWATATLVAQTASNALPAANTWFSWAVTVSGTTLRIFVNGVLLVTATGFTTPATSTDGVTVGATLRSSGYWDGQHDEVRILKGVAAYTANYTPETSAFDDDIGGYAVAPAVLAGPALVGQIDAIGWVAAASPLSPPALLSATVLGIVNDTGPLRQPSLRSVLVSGAVSDGGVLRQPSVLSRATFVRVAAPSLLGAPILVGHHDFTSQLDLTATPTYVMELTTPTGVVRVPISSWQATLTTSDRCYSQCVIPAVTEWVPTLEVATDFVVYRASRLLTGDEYRVAVTFAPVETTTEDQGPRRHTATVSGYTDPYPVYAVPPLAARPLTGVRLRSSVNGRLRVQCSIDWTLRPGHSASVDGQDFEVEYINYYCNTDGESMMVGEA